MPFTHCIRAHDFAKTAVVVRRARTRAAPENKSGHKIPLSPDRSSREQGQGVNRRRRKWIFYYLYPNLLPTSHYYYSGRLAYPGSSAYQTTPNTPHLPLPFLSWFGMGRFYLTMHTHISLMICCAFYLFAVYASVSAGISLFSLLLDVSSIFQDGSFLIEFCLSGLYYNQWVHGLFPDRFVRSGVPLPNRLHPQLLGFTFKPIAQPEMA